MLKKISFISLVCIVAIVAGVLTISYFRSFQDVSITIKNPIGSLELTVYKASQSGDELEKSKEPLRKITRNETFSLRNGSYLLVPKGDNIVAQDIPLIVKGSNITKVIDIGYTQAYLDSLLAIESASITNEITDAYPKITGLYTVQPGRLFHRGEWFGTTLVSKQTDPEANNNDTLRIILEKNASTQEWTIVTNPPGVVIGGPSYPTVPIEIIKQVNLL